jgi:hypothetical protein
MRSELDRSAVAVACFSRRSRGTKHTSNGRIRTMERKSLPQQEAALTPLTEEELEKVAGARSLADDFVMS